MESNVLFSIIVPAYQVENYITECLQSLLSQGESETEIIIVDDGSTDKTGEIARRYVSENDNITVIHQENQGLSAARNTGIHNAKGKYCVFVDSDDLLCKNALLNLKNCIKRNNEPDVVVSRRQTMYPNDEIKECEYVFEEREWKRFSAVNKYKKMQTMKDFWLGTWIFSVKTKYLRKNSLYFPYGLLHEDEEWVPKLLLNTESIACNNELLYCNRVEREGSITQTKNIKREFDKLQIIDLLQREAEKNQYSEDKKKIFIERNRSLYYGVLSSIGKYRKDKNYKNIVMQLSEKKNILKNSNKTHHKICYILVNVFGINLTSLFLEKCIYRGK